MQTPQEEAGAILASSQASEDEEETAPLPDPQDTPALFKSIQTLFRRELQKVLTEFTSQVQELGQRVSDAEQKLDEIADTIESDRQDISDHAERLATMELKLEDLENRSRRANVRIRGLPETHTDLKGTVTTLFKALLPGTTEELLRFDRIHRALVKPRNADVPRDIILRLHYPEVRDAIMAAARNLDPLPGMTPQVRLYTDLAPSTLERRRSFRPVTLALLKHNVKYRWGFPFSLSFTIRNRTYIVRSFNEAQEALKSVDISLEDLDAYPKPQRSARPARSWTTVKPTTRQRREDAAATSNPS